MQILRSVIKVVIIKKKKNIIRLCFKFFCYPESDFDSVRNEFIAFEMKKKRKKQVVANSPRSPTTAVRETARSKLMFFFFTDVGINYIKVSRNG